jgi:predicted DCC family thiol-disulfide oxidoreductase YuxK
MLVELPASPRPVILYDGVCGFCDRFVRFLLARDREAALRFAPLQGLYARSVLERHPALRGVDSVVLVEHGAGGERVCARSTAALRAMALLGGGWRVVLLVTAVPRPLRDLLYDLFARWRYRLFGRYDSCPVMPPEFRDRFLEHGPVAGNEAAP